jgi:hypothetical protein
MAHSTLLGGRIEWWWLMDGESAPRLIGAAIRNGRYHPDGTLLLDFIWVDDYGEGRGYVRLTAVPGTNELNGTGGNQQGSHQWETSEIRCKLAKANPQEWKLEGIYWREPTKETHEWNATLKIMGQQPWEELPDDQ